MKLPNVNEDAFIADCNKQWAPRNMKVIKTRDGYVYSMMSGTDTIIYRYKTFDSFYYSVMFGTPPDEDMTNVIQFKGGN